MRLKIVLSGLLGCLIGAAYGAPSLCTKSETVYFSCTAKTGKIISLCGQVFKPGPSGWREASDAPWLQYRYGRPGASELVFPSSTKDSLQRFAAQRIRAQGGQLRIDAIAFVSGGIGYSVQSVTPDSAESWEGLDIGDPRSFDLDRGPKPRDRYPRAEIRCTKGANTAEFFDLVEYLDGN
ncbi:hypothetical protein [Massilia sp. LjRoot122]|uniref:hypothetical protein n=1 Tax=Massilia sp. LjRoot122 TaxID=3342257 RepID=UPI003ECEB417